MTPLEYGQQLLKSLESYLTGRGISVPRERYAQYGDVVASCESLVVSCQALDGREMPQWQCDFVQIGAYTIVLSRECANTANDDGTTNIEATNSIMRTADRDTEALWDWAAGLEAWLEKAVSVSWVITGALLITTLQLSTGVP